MGNSNFALINDLKINIMKLIRPSLRAAGITILLLLLAVTGLYAQIPTYLSELRNDIQVDSHTYEYDIYLLRTGSTVFELTSMQCGLNINPSAINGGTITVSLVSGTSELLIYQIPGPIKFTFTAAKNSINMTAMSGPGAGSGTVISNTGYGTRVGRIRISNSVDFGSVQPNLTWGWAISKVNVITRVNAYIGITATDITVQAGHTTSHLVNAVLNPAATPPVASAVTGGGLYCQGGTGLPVGVANSELGVTYTLFKNAAAQTPTVAGTGSAISFGNQLSGTYTVSGTNSGGTNLMSGSVIITENAAIATPTGIAVQSICSGTSSTVASLTATGTGTIQWYATSTGGTALSTSTALVNGTHYFASQVISGCESPVRLGVTVSITPSPTGTSAQIFCSGTSPVVADLTATGTGIKWYAALTGGTALATSVALVNGIHYFASQTLAGCESISRFDVTATVKTTPSAPTGTAAQSFCSASLPTVANLTASGTSVKWYSVSTGGSSLSTATALVTGAHYFASQTVSGCESSTRFDVTATVNVTPGAPTGTAIQSLCSGASATIAGLTAIPGGSGIIKWYAASSGGSALSTATSVANGIHYYASQVVNSCESSARLDVTVNITAAPTGVSSQVFCSGVSPDISDLAISGSGIQWYTASSGGVLLATSTALVNGTHYFASQTLGGCESILRFDVTATVNMTPVAPTGTSVQTFCSGASPTLSNLTVTGTAIKWYDALSGGNLLATSTALVNGTHYYASQTINGCESSLRFDVTATVNVTPGAPTGSATQSFCSGVSPTIAGLIATGTAIKWYAASGGGSALATSAVLANGTHYYATQTVDGCESRTRLDITAIVTTSLPTSVSITPSANPVCTGTSVTFTATPVVGGGAPTYQWYKNTIAVTTGATYVCNPNNGDVVYVVMTSNAPCATANPATSNSITMVVNSFVGASVSVGVNQNNVCAGTSVIFTATPVGGGATPTYQWFKNTVAVATNATYTYVPVNGDLVYVVMTSSLSCATGSPATSGSITMVVNPVVAAGVSMGVNQNNVCSGTSVTFTATPSGGGSAPIYQWYKNTVAVSAGITFTYTPVNGDVVYVVMTSNATCATGSPAISGSIKMTVNPTGAASVSIGVSKNNICPGTMVTMTASPIVGGSTPNYQWYKNTIAVTAGATYTYSPVNGDNVYCVMTSNAACATGSPTTSNSVAMVVNPLVAAAGAIIGSALFTPGTSGVPYSVATIANATSYIWSYTGTGVTIIGTGTNVTLNFSASATSGQITVKGHNACGDGAQSFLNFMGAKTLSFTSVLLEGLYDGGGIMRQARDGVGPHWPTGIADHITVELHSSSNYATILYTQTDVPLSTTGTASISVPGNFSDSYYITIRHRNSLETTTAAAVSFAGTAINQSFGAPSNVFGGNLGASIDLSYYLIYAGDVNQDGLINAQDFIGIDSDSYNYVTGYLATDVDGNGTIDTNDYISVDNNNYNHIGVARP